MNQGEFAYQWEWKNTSGEEIPAFAPFEVDGWARDEEHGLYLEGDQPGTGDPHALTAINGPSPVGAGKWGTCACPQLLWGAVKNNASTEHGDTLGGKKDETYLEKDEKGYTQLGDIDSGPAQHRALIFHSLGGGGGEVNIGLAVVTEEVGAMTHAISGGNGSATLGQGLGKELVISGDIPDITLTPTGGEVDLFNSTTGKVAVDKIVHFKKFDEVRIIDAEDCG